MSVKTKSKKSTPRANVRRKVDAKLVVTVAPLAPAVVTPPPVVVAELEVVPAVASPAIVTNAPAPVAEYPTREVVWNEALMLAPFRNPLGVAIPGRMGVFTQDGILLGAYSKGESVLPNAELLAYFEDALTSLGFSFEREILVLQGGAEIKARYTIRSAGFNGPDGLPFVARLVVENSYNGTRKVAAALELLRLVCFNGCTGLRSAFSLEKRHSGGLDAKGIIAKVSPEIEAGMLQLQNAMVELGRVEITENQGRFALRNLAQACRLKFSPLMARRIETKAWNTPAEDEKPSHGTLFGLLNAGTRTFRDMERDGKVELVEKSAPYFALALQKMATEPESLKRMLAPIEWEAAYGVKEGDE